MWMQILKQTCHPHPFIVQPYTLLVSILIPLLLIVVLLLRVVLSSVGALLMPHNL
jgi:hypothetical protein